MVTHKRNRLTPHDRQKIWQLWQTGQYKVSALAERTESQGQRFIRHLPWPGNRSFYREKVSMIGSAPINFYNTVKPHKGIDNMTPHEKLIKYFYDPEV